MQPSSLAIGGSQLKIGHGSNGKCDRFAQSRKPLRAGTGDDAGIKLLDELT
jgi:hypothetical protein